MFSPDKNKKYKHIISSTVLPPPQTGAIIILKFRIMGKVRFSGLRGMPKSALANFKGEEVREKFE